MNIQEVSEILGLTRALLAPQHVFITDEPVTAKLNGQAKFRGLQPVSKGGVIFITKDGDSTTPIHESIHSQFGFDELATKPLTRIIHAKVRAMNNFPKLKKLIQKPIKYQLCKGSCGFPEAHSDKFGKRVKHYVLV